MLHVSEFLFKYSEMFICGLTRIVKKSISAYAQAHRDTPCGFVNNKTVEPRLVELCSTTTPAVLQGLVRHR